ncbi:DUF2572 family protein [Haloimpatiens lingqiaonensis]|uniref:DUF2572 family protein n=1 Tax=Haloimpatiens lingqiaonensis TaxID=1380675 RepID=UPI0010FF4B7F|nr:DUF2572 family protein [Haloimpatiens lingqiaonensis]
MLKKKKGSTLYMVLIIMSILFVFGTAMFTLALSTNNTRYLKSDIKGNLYGAESGLDIAYSIVNEHVNMATKEANEEVEKYMQDFIEKELIKAREEGSSPYINKDFSLNTGELFKEQDRVFKEKYKIALLREKVSEDKKGKISLLEDLEDLDQYKAIIGKTKKEQEIPVVTVENKDEIETHIDDFLKDSSKNILDLSLKSDFNHKGITKAVSCNFAIGIPKYSGSKIGSNTVKIQNNAAWSKAINVGGNMHVKDETTIDGDIYVGKNLEIQDNGNLNAQGKISIFEDFIINSSSKNNVVGNIYGRNVILSKNVYGAELNVTKNEKFNGSLYTKDDLEINGESCKVFIEGDYYGLEDRQDAGKPDYYGLENGQDAGKPDKSSCIIINSEDIRDEKENDVRLNIGGTAYILGTSYIKTSPLYQTGESLSIKGNYLAYTYPLTDAYTSNENRNLKDVQFKYYSPLALADTFRNGMKLTSRDKSEYFQQYHNQYKDKEEYKENQSILSKVKLGGYFTAGAVVSNGKVGAGSYNVSGEEKIIEAKKEYITEVLNMGDKLKDYDHEVTIQSDKLKSLDDYKNNFKSMDRQYKDGSRILVVQGDYSLSKDKDFKKGILIVKGDLNIDQDVDFTGTIIVTGNLNLSKNCKITYNEALVKKLIADNYSEFKDIFPEEENGQYSYVNINPTWNKGNAFIREKIIKVSKWKILK